MGFDMNFDWSILHERMMGKGKAGDGFAWFCGISLRERRSCQSRPWNMYGHEHRNELIFA
jgi:hypothetical protein